MKFLRGNVVENDKTYALPTEKATRRTTAAQRAMPRAIARNAASYQMVPAEAAAAAAKAMMNQGKQMQ